MALGLDCYPTVTRWGHYPSFKERCEPRRSKYCRVCTGVCPDHIGSLQGQYRGFIGPKDITPQKGQPNGKKVENELEGSAEILP